MAHLPALVSDLALILITAGIFTLLFKWLKQPVVLGYIVAGFLISPNFVLLPSVADTVNISAWAEIGVIFLLFALGLEFSFKKLIDVGGKATIATLINMGSMIAIGYLIGVWMGWSRIECWFLGGMLSMSSTTIIIKAFNDMGLQKQKFAGIVFGMLIVEDLAAILLMVLLTTISVSQNFEGRELLDNGLKLVFFMLIWFIVGIYLIPTLLKKVKKYLNDETLLIIAVGLCLGMVLFANEVGFSAALGAFIMGSILAETIESKHIEHLIEPLKNLFGAVFFVSVGMMIIPSVIVDYAMPILIFTVVVLIGRVIFATLGVLASGEGLKVSLQSGFSLAQIGEFSFIIATLGMQLGVISDFIYPIIVTVSVITTFTTPYFIKAANPVYNWLEIRTPDKWDKLLSGYGTSVQRNINRTNDWNRLLKSILISVPIYFVISIAIIAIDKNFLEPFLLNQLPNMWGYILSAVIPIILMLPFMSAIIRKGNHSPEAQKLWTDSHFNKAALISLNIFRILLCAVLVAIVLIPLFKEAFGLIVIISVLLALVLSLYQGFRGNTERMEKIFLDNLNSKELEENKKRAVSQKLREDLLDKNIHIEEIVVHPNSPRVGKTLAELNFRKSTGVNIVAIIRGREKINIPDGNVRLYPYDRIVIAGTDEEVKLFVKFIESRNKTIDENAGEVTYHIELSQYEIEEGSSLIGKTIKELDIQRKTECLVTGIERECGIIATSNTADIVLEEGDTLWLAGEKVKLRCFEENLFA